MQISPERKEPLAWNKMYFSSFLNDFQLTKIVSDPRVGLYTKSSDTVYQNIFKFDVIFHKP